jgi:hypothetical protein
MLAPAAVCFGQEFHVKGENMHYVLAVLAGAAAGYGMRGLVNKELKAAYAELKTLLADVKADLQKMAADAKKKL